MFFCFYSAAMLAWAIEYNALTKMKYTNFKSNVHLHTWLHVKNTIVIISQKDSIININF